MTFTDYLHQPVKVGDVVAYSVKSGSSSVTTNLAVIVALDEIIPNSPSDPQCREGVLHSDRNRSCPPRRTIQAIYRRAKNGRTVDYYRDDTKAYRATVRRLQEGYTGPDSESIWVTDHNKKVSILNVANLIVVTDKVSQELRDLAEELSA